MKMPKKKLSPRSYEESERCWCQRLGVNPDSPEGQHKMRKRRDRLRRDADPDRKAAHRAKQYAWQKARTKALNFWAQEGLKSWLNSLEEIQ